MKVHVDTFHVPHIVYQIDTTEEEYRDADDVYESLQLEVFIKRENDYHERMLELRRRR